MTKYLREQICAYVNQKRQGQADAEFRSCSLATKDYHFVE